MESVILGKRDSSGILNAVQPIEEVRCAAKGDLLLSGDASRLYQGLVKGRELSLQVQGGVSFPFESPWRTGGPTLLSSFGL